MHEDMTVANQSISAKYSYHANDNAFLNYGDAWFQQRTLVVRTTAASTFSFLTRLLHYCSLLVASGPLCDVLSYQLLLLIGRLVSR